MAKYIYVLNLLVIAFFLSCTSSPNAGQTQMDKKRIEPAALKTIKLDLDSLVLGHVTGYAIGDNSDVYMTDGRIIVQTDKDGKPISHVNRQGPGPSEYVKLRNLAIYNGHLYAWDAMGLSLLEFDLDLNFVSKMNGPGIAIKDFLVTSSGDVYYYLAGNPDHLIAKTFADYPDSIKYEGGISAEDEALLIYTYSKCMGVLDGEVFYSSPSRMELKCFEGRKQDICLSDDDFKVEEVKGTPSRDMNAMFEYINRNSVITGLSQGRKNNYLLTETGTVTVENNIADTSQRMINILAFDREGSVLSGIQLPLRTGNYKMVGDRWYSLEYTEDEDLILNILDVDEVL